MRLRYDTIEEQAAVWAAAADVASDLRLEARVAHASALLASEEKSADKREAAARLESAEVEKLASKARHFADALRVILDAMANGR